MRSITGTAILATFVFLLVPGLSANNSATPASRTADDPANSVAASRADTQPDSEARTTVPTEQPQEPQGMGSSAIPATRSYDRNYPKVDLFLGYSYWWGVPRDTGNRMVELNGGSTSLAYNFNDWFGVAVDFAGYDNSRLILNGPGGASREVHSDGDAFTYLAGPRFSYRRLRRITPFAQVLLGAAHASTVSIEGCTGIPACTPLPSETAFALTAGAGLDVNLNRHFAIRLIQAEYMMTKFNNAANLTSSGLQNNVRLSAGIVFRFGGHPAPPPVNHPPTASCSADKSMVFVGSGDAVAVTATAADPDNDPLTYTWTASGGRVDGNGATVRWLSDGTAEGSYTVNLKVDDGRDGTATCGVTVAVQQKPNHPPTISCTANPTSIFAGERSTITCNASDPDGDTLSYTWRANAGKITGNGPRGDFDSTGLSPGDYTITTRVDDGRGGAADASTTVTVKPTPPPPQASKINECAFNRALSSRIDNVCKRILDDVALRMQSEPRASAVIIGYSDPKERRGDKIAADRGANAVKYLGEKGIDASRVTTRTGSGQAGAKNNRRIDIIWVPEGATY